MFLLNRNLILRFPSEAQHLRKETCKISTPTMFQCPTNSHNHFHWACILVLIQRHLHLCLQHCWSKTIQHPKPEKNPQAIEIEVDFIPLFKKFFAAPKGNWKRARNPNIPNLIMRFNPSISPRAPRWIWLAERLVSPGGQPGATSNWIKIAREKTHMQCMWSIYASYIYCKCLLIFIYIYIYTYFHPMFLKYPWASSKETL